jgi:hypothetical protein
LSIIDTRVFSSNAWPVSDAFRSAPTPHRVGYTEFNLKATGLNVKSTKVVFASVTVIPGLVCVVYPLAEAVTVKVPGGWAIR